MKSDEIQSKIYMDIGDRRIELFKELAEAREVYGGGNDSESAYQSWVDSLHAIWKFLMSLDPPNDELTPIIGLTGALADLNQGLQHPALTKVHKKTALLFRTVSVRI